MLWLKMTPKQLSNFLAVCRLGSMSAAAAELGIAQPALSKQIHQLEHELQTSLFERHSRGVKLTDAGGKLRKEAAELIRRIEAIKSAVREEADQVAGSVTLAVITSIAPALAVELFPRVERDYPNIDLHIVDYPSDRVGKALLRQEADLAIFPNAATDFPAVAGTPLFREDLHLISIAKPDDSAAPVSFADAARQPLALPFHAHDLRRRIEEAAKSTGTALNVKYQTGSINVIGRLVEEGLACSIVPPTFWLDKINAGRISARPVVSPEIYRVHSLCWLPDRAMPPAAQVLRSVVTAELRAMLSSGALRGHPINHAGGQ